MFAIRKRSTQILVGVAAAAALLLTGGAAQAVLTGHSGGSSVSMTGVTEEGAWGLPAASQGTWVNVTGQVRSVTVPSGTTRRFVAEYNAESLCSGTGWCSVRIVALNSAGAAWELFPRSGTDFAFDTDGDSYSAHSVKRTIRLGAGTWRFQVQAARVAGSSTTSPALRLDEHYFDVDTRV